MPLPSRYASFALTRISSNICSIRCHQGGEWKSAQEFSRRQLQKALTSPEFNPEFSGISCSVHTRGEPTLQCERCGLNFPVDSFSHNSRRSEEPVSFRSYNMNLTVLLVKTDKPVYRNAVVVSHGSKRKSTKFLQFLSRQGPSRQRRRCNGPCTTLSFEAILTSLPITINQGYYVSWQQGLTNANMNPGSSHGIIHIGHPSIVREQREQQQIKLCHKQQKSASRIIFENVFEFAATSKRQCLDQPNVCKSYKGSTGGPTTSSSVPGSGSWLYSEHCFFKQSQLGSQLPQQPICCMDIRFYEARASQREHYKVGREHQMVKTMTQPNVVDRQDADA